jgi:hypothetical protein
MPAALAFEPLYAFNTPPGVMAGLPTGSNPPEGLYFINFANGGQGKFSGTGTSTGIAGLKYDIAGESPVLLWTTPWKVAGASWAMLAAVPMVGVDLKSDSTTVARVRGFNNPGFAPMMLSWHLGGGLFAKLGVLVWGPAGTIEAGSFNNGLGNIGAPYWTIDQHLAISYLANGLNLTANLIHSINTKNTYSGVTNGSSLNIDLTATRKFNGIELGPVAYLGTQVTSDSGCDAFYGPGVCAHGAKAGIGGLIGYDFGFVHARLAVTDSVYRRNASDGWRAWTT